MSSQRSRLAADFAIDEAALAAAHAHTPEEAPEVVVDGIELTFGRGGEECAPYPKNAYESEDEERAARESRLDRISWAGNEDGRAYVEREAERILQKENGVVPRGGGGDGGRKKDPGKRKYRSYRIVIVDEEQRAYPCTRVHVGHITRGAKWFYHARFGDARAWLEVLADLLEKGEIPPSLPRRKNKNRLYSFEVWGVMESKAEILSRYPRVASQWLNLVALERGSERVKYLNDMDMDDVLENAV